MSVVLAAAAHAWASDDFNRRLKAELEGLPPASLPLDAGVANGGRADDRRIVATVLRSSADAQTICATVGIFFDEIVAGCSCGDEPQSLAAYCEIEVRIDQATAQAAFALCRDAPA